MILCTAEMFCVGSGFETVRLVQVFFLLKSCRSHYMILPAVILTDFGVHQQNPQTARKHNYF